MRRPDRRRTAVTLAASMVVHAAVLSVVALQSPTLATPEQAGGPPTPVIPILILPKAPPARPGGPPRPVNLHQRALRNAQTPPPVAPLVTPKAEAEPRPPPSAPTLDAFKVRPEPATRDVQAALRGRVGCANPDAVGLSQAERDACNQALAAGARDAPFTGLGLDRDKSRSLDAAAAQREADYRYKRMIPRSAPRTPGAPLEYDVQRSPPNGVRNMPGVSSEDLGAEPTVIRRF